MHKKKRMGEMKGDSRMKCRSHMKRALFYVSVALAAAGCVPGETVVTVTAADVECAMTGGVARAEVVMVLTNSVPAIDPKKLPERVLKDLKSSATKSPVDVMLEVLEPMEESFARSMPPGDTIKMFVQPDGTNVLLRTYIRQTAYFSSDTNKLAACHYRNLRLHIDEKGRLDFFVDESFKELRSLFAMWMGIAFDRVLERNLVEDCGIGYFLFDLVLDDPFRVKTRKVRITGEGASRFRVDGTRILHTDALIKPTLSTK